MVGSGSVCLNALEACALARAEEVFVGATFFFLDIACTSCGGRFSVIDPPPVPLLLGGLYEIWTGLLVVGADVAGEGVARLVLEAAVLRIALLSWGFVVEDVFALFDPFGESSLRSRRADNERSRA